MRKRTAARGAHWAPPTDSNLMRVQVVGGVLLALFQLLGRSQAERFIGVGEAGWYLELRLWVLAGLSTWLIGSAAVMGTRRFDGRGVGAFGGMFVLFLGYMVVITSLWAPDPTRAATKAYDLLFVIWSCVLTVVALRTCGVRATIDGFWGGVFVFALVIAVIGAVTSVVSWVPVGRFSVLSGGPNVLGRNMGLLALASLHLVFDARRLRRVIGMAAAPVAALLVLLSGSRGAILALCFGVIVYLFVHRLDRRVLVSLVAVAILGAAVAVATRFGELAVALFRDRVLILLFVDQFFSYRDVLFLEAIRAGLQNPVFGLGLAGFEEVGTWGGYPHNMFLEAFAEGGLPGLLLLCLPFVRYLARWLRGMGLGDSLTVAGLGLLVVSSSISGDLFDARGVFLLLLMAVASQTRDRTAGKSGAGQPTHDER